MYRLFHYASALLDFTQALTFAAGYHRFYIHWAGMSGYRVHGVDIDTMV